MPSVPEAPLIEQVEGRAGQIPEVVSEFLDILEKQYKQQMQNVCAEWYDDPSLTQWQEQVDRHLQTQVAALLAWAKGSGRM